MACGRPATWHGVFAIEAGAASLAAAERQFAALDQFATLLRGGRHLYPQAASLPDATERALVGGIASILSGHLLMEDPQAISALEEQLVDSSSSLTSARARRGG